MIILKKNMNIGEKSEYFVKAFLLKQKDKELEDTVFGKIHQLSDDGNLKELEWKKEAESFLEKFEIEELVKTLGIKKSKSNSKSDISINNISYSIKETSAAPPAIVNHTSRKGFEFACKKCGSSIKKLDEIIESYWSLRLEGIIKQDVKAKEENSPFISYKEYFKPIIEYFLFTGTGSKISNFPAMMMLEIDDYKKLPNGIKIIEKKDYFEQIWDKLVFSVRSKGMPKYYTEKDDGTTALEYESIAKWTRKINGKYKGSLHIRA